MKSLTQIVHEAGFQIKTESDMDRVGPCHKVTIKHGGKQTMRRARKYDEALALCAEARGIEINP